MYSSSLEIKRPGGYILRCEYLKLDYRNPTKGMSDAGKPLAV